MEEHYKINIFWDEDDKLWVADIPQLFVCSASGNTPEEALREVQEAKRLYLEAAQDYGKPLPVPDFNLAESEQYSRQYI